MGKVLFSIENVGEHTAIRAEATPQELVNAFAAIFAQSDMFKAIVCTALDMSEDEKTAEELNNNKVHYEEGVQIKTKGDA